ncbi:peroxiredoxin Q/BCP [Homoserinimonas aerilata]|uniref:thioredoxin-dependent peroxiredoxin n=1 Tax=Homoserinimonas aerilata TaxID=1162970 RepID=A0A542YHD0_9MICO|nr:thioredoxin-dependent thiol peroxidase [Homoserinimonas aerilata]TQL47487.1 peroxiredoxin Q/BCP [Homoserinimonas aerilata]
MAETTTTPAEGSAAPAFTLGDQDGKQVSLSDFRGQKVIVYFYPAASTPGCTKQACDFRDSLGSLSSAGYQVIGVSKDSPEKLKKFQQEEALPFPLLSDVSLEVHRAYGAWGEKNSYGRIIEGTIRSTFVIDEQGVIEHALHNVKATGHVARLRKMLDVDA